MSSDLQNSSAVISNANDADTVRHSVESASETAIAEVKDSPGTNERSDNDAEGASAGPSDANDFSEAAETVREEDEESQSALEIDEFSAAEEYALRRQFRRVTLQGGDRSVDMRLVEPYRDVIRHGGYVDASCAVVTLSLEHLPSRAVADYDYVLENVFLYVLSTLEQIIVSSYILVVVNPGSHKHQSAAREAGSGHVDMPSMKWLRAHHSLVKHQLRKSLKLAIVLNASLRFRTFSALAGLYVSSKVKRKVHYVKTTKELARFVPLDNVYLPESLQLKTEVAKNQARKSSVHDITAEDELQSEARRRSDATGMSRSGRPNTVLF